MNRIIKKDKQLRISLNKINITYFLLKLIIKNKNLFFFTRLNAYIKITNLTKKASFISISNRCIISYNKKRFNKYTLYSRIILLKKIQCNEIVGLKKSIW